MGNLEANLLLGAVGLYLLASVLYFLYAAVRKEKVGGAASWAILLGAILHSGSLLARIFASGRLPFSNLYESMTVFAWGIVIIYLAVEYLYKLRLIGTIAAPIAFLAALYASTLNKEIAPLMPALQSNWLLAHVGVAVVAYGVFAVSFGTAILSLIFPKEKKFDQLTYQLIAFAFPFLTLVVITGAVWAEQAWGTYWSWDPKETWSLITWLVYLGYLHARLVLKWKGRTAAWFAIIGFLVVIFTYLGVSFLLSGLHSYAS